MALSVTHAKTNAITDWTQAQLNTQIALGNFPAGTTLANITLPSDWNAGHTLTGIASGAQGGTGTDNGTATLTVTGAASVSGTNTGDQTSVTGNAGTVTVGAESTDTTCFLLFSTAATGSLSPKTNTNLTYNSNTSALANVGQVSFSVTDTTDAWVSSFDEVASPLFSYLQWNPASDSTSVRFAIGGYTQKISANGGTGTTHYGGVIGYAQKNHATGTDPFVVGVEGRVGALAGTITSAAAGVFTFDTNTEDAGTMTIGIGVYVPDQTDAGHISVPFAIYNQWAAAPVRSLGVYQGPDGAVGSPSYQFVNATSTGIYLSAANTVGVTANGALMLAVGATIDITDAKNVTTGTGTGTKWGTATNQKQGWFNKTPVVQQTDGAGLTNNVTSGGTTDTIADFTSLTVYASDAAAIRNDIYQLARKVKIIGDALRTYGFLS